MGNPWVSGDSHPWEVRSKQPLVRLGNSVADRTAITHVENGTRNLCMMYEKKF